MEDLVALVVSDQVPQEPCGCSQMYISLQAGRNLAGLRRGKSSLGLEPREQGRWVR